MSSGSLPVAGASLAELTEPDDELVTLTVCTSVIEVEMQKMHLDGAGIPCRVLNDASSLYPSLGTGGIPILVHPSRLDDARDVLVRAVDDEGFEHDQWRAGAADSEALQPVDDDAALVARDVQMRLANRALAGALLGAFVPVLGLVGNLYSLVNLATFLKGDTRVARGRAVVALVADGAAVVVAVRLLFSLLGLP